MTGASIALVGGLIILVVASDQFVLGAARLALTLRVRPVIVGAIVVGFGTSAPEMLVSGLAASRGSLDIAIGNVAGSNLANVTLVLGLAAIVAPLTVASATLRREAPVAAAAVSLFAAFMIGGFQRWEGVVLVVGLVGALSWFTHAELTSRREERQVEEYADTARPHPLPAEIVRTLIGLAGTVGGAHLLVTGATDVARELGVSESVIGLTLVAVGTSLPELATALQAARRKQAELIVGNVLGSNIFNSLGVAGVAVLIAPGAVVDARVLGTAAGFMIIAAYGSWLFLRTERKLVRWEGVALVVGYAVALAVSSLT